MKRASCRPARSPTSSGSMARIWRTGSCMRMWRASGSISTKRASSIPAARRSWPPSSLEDGRTARREKPGFRDFEGQPKEASPALERREGTGGGACRHQRDRRGGRGARARPGSAGEEERERREDGGGREGVHDVCVRDGRQERESETREEAEDGDGL